MFVISHGSERREREREVRERADTAFHIYVYNDKEHAFGKEHGNGKAHKIFGHLSYM